MGEPTGTAGAEPPLRFERSAGVATITLSRPDALNALDRRLKTELRMALERARDDRAVRALVLTGAGRAFCVGQDLREYAADLESDASAQQALTTVRDDYNPIVRTLALMPKPTVAAVNGAAAGAGAGLAFACDLRVLAANAKLSMAFAGIGLSVDSGTSWTLQRLVGFGRATAMLLLGEPVDAAHALEMGLATSVCPAEDVKGEAAALARRLAEGPTAAYAAIKEALAYGTSASLDESLEKEAVLQLRAGSTRDHQQAVRSFLAKERPSFSGD